MSDNRICIIGANSYIGRHMILKIKKCDSYDLRLYDYQKEQVDGVKNYTQVNILDTDDIKKIDLNCDVIYLFAGMTGTKVGFKNYKQFIEINEIGLLNILTLYLEQKSSAKIVFPSTRLVYKGNNSLLEEDDEKEFNTIYAINKYACENYLKMYNKIFDVKYAILRICVPYGNMLPGEMSYGTAGFFKRLGEKGETISIYGEGSQRRTLIHIEDLVNVMILAGENQQCVNDVYNVGGDCNLSIKEIAEVFASIYNVSVQSKAWLEEDLKIESGDTMFDSSKLDKIISYTYMYNFQKWAQDECEG